ncbi:MAG: HD-GYP domain-containing protein [Gemmatimonadales bacterium]|nr:HD-GYP domain-containing protein [Gemmatimonadales bacterium]
MTDANKTKAFVLAVVVVAILALIASYAERVAFPGMWALGSFVFAAYLLDLTNNPLQLGAIGSTSFIIHMAAGVQFGGYWGALVAGLSTLMYQAFHRPVPIKLAFNVAQRSLSVAAALLAYKAAGGSIQPSYLNAEISLRSLEAQRDLALFIVVAVVYFAINTVALNTVIALSSGKRFREVWNVNARGVLGYDIAASFLSIALAYVYTAAERSLGFGALGFAAVLVPILVIRHIYGLYRKLQSSGRELLDLMVKAIEARDPYTSGHSVRVATLAKAIAHEAKMSAEEVEQVYTAAVMHDVGKIHEEFAPLLRKDSKLTPEETALLQTHPVKSADLVGIISSFRGTVQDAVRSHHERWDGGGYPDGLAGESIPLGARIIMISDTTDAMTTDRPYRKRLPIDAVVAELQKYRGTQFDPRLVDLVVNSVTVRRVMAEVSAASSRPADPTIDSGSKRVQAAPGGLLRGRPSWPRIRAF